MLTANVYDWECLSRAVIATAEQVAGREARHFHAADVRWPEQGGADHESIWPVRDYRFRAELMKCFDELKSAAEGLVWRGVDLLEVIRYDWIFANEEQLWRSWVVASLARRGEFDRIVWSTNATEYLPTVRAACRQNNLRLVAQISKVQAIRDLFNSTFQAARNAAWRVRESWRQRAKCQRLPAPDGEDARPIVVVENYPNSVKVSLRVAESLESIAGERIIFVGARRAVCDFLASRGRRCLPFEQFASYESPPTESEISAIVREASAALHRACENRGETGAQNQSARILPSAAITVAANLRRLLLDAIREARKSLGMLRRLRPRAVVSTSYAGSFGRAIALACEARDIPSAYVQHGALGESAFFRHFPHRRVLLWGDNVARSIQAAGFPAERIRVVGATIYDDARPRGEQTKAPERPEHGGTRVLLLASRAGGSMVNRELYVEILTATRRAVQAIPGATLTIKIHPSDHTGIAHRLFGNTPGCEITRDGNVSQMLDQCDVAIVTSSTTGVEACVRDVPLIEFNPVDIELPIDYERYGAALSARNSSELLSAIQRAIGDPGVRGRLKEGRQRLVADILGGADGAASDRAADAILDLCHECIR